MHRPVGADAAPGRRDAPNRLVLACFPAHGPGNYGGRCLSARRDTRTGRCNGEGRFGLGPRRRIQLAGRLLSRCPWSPCQSLTIRLPRPEAERRKHKRPQNRRELPCREQRQRLWLHKEPHEHEARNQGQARGRQDSREPYGTNKAVHAEPHGNADRAGAAPAGGKSTPRAPGVLAIAPPSRSTSESFEIRRNRSPATDL